MERPETRFARTAEGLHIAYQVVGDGPVDIVYIAGWFSNVDLIWDETDIAPFLRQLARHHRLIVFDRRGTGLSDAVAEPVHFDVMMDDIRVVMDACGSERAFLIGITMGASLACLFAATYPERSLGLALLQAQSRSAWSPDHPWGETLEVSREQSERIDAGWGTGEFERWFLRRLPYADDRRGDPAFIERTARYLRNSMTPRLATWQNQTWIETDVTDVLPVVHVPALVVEREDTPDATEDLVARLPLAELVRIPGQSVLPWIPGTERVAEAIERFVRDLRAQEEGLERVLATVLFTDIVDSTSQASSLGDTGWRETQQAHDRAVRASLARFRGREIKTMGDGFLATFDGPARAVRCAEAIVQTVGPLRIEIRAGLHTGEIGSDGDDITGVAVAIASRVAALAGPSEILVSSTVKDLVAGSGLAFEDAGEHELKGVPDRWHLYRVASGPGQPATR